MYKQSKKVRQQKMNYQKSAKGKNKHNKANKKYKHTIKGKEANRRYDQSKKGKMNQWKKYGLSIEKRKEMYLNQNGCCFICKNSVPYEDIKTDHNHNIKGIKGVRGLVCNLCNSFIGFIEKYPELVEPIQEYLKMFNKYLVGAGDALP